MKVVRALHKNSVYNFQEKAFCVKLRRLFCLKRTVLFCFEQLASNKSIEIVVMELLIFYTEFIEQFNEVTFIICCQKLLHPCHQPFRIKVFRQFINFILADLIMTVFRFFHIKLIYIDSTIFKFEYR